MLRDSYKVAGLIAPRRPYFDYRVRQEVVVGFAPVHTILTCNYADTVIMVVQPDGTLLTFKFGRDQKARNMSDLLMCGLFYCLAPNVPGGLGGIPPGLIRTRYVSVWSRCQKKTL